MQKIHDFVFNGLKFKSSQHDPCLYVKQELKNLTITSLYVNGLLIVGTSRSKVNETKGEVKNRL